MSERRRLQLAAREKNRRAYERARVRAKSRTQWQDPHNVVALAAVVVFLLAIAIKAAQA